MSPPARGRTRVIAPRGLMLLAAIAVCAWFVVGVRQVQDEDHVDSAVIPPITISAAQARSADATLNDAAFLNPDRSVQGLRAIVTFKSGHPAQGISMAKAFTRREPENFEAWLLLGELTVQADPAVFRMTQARLNVLVPPVAPPR